MEEFIQIALYVVIGLIFLLSQFSKKKNVKTSTTVPQPSQQVVLPSETQTFKKQNKPLTHTHKTKIVETKKKKEPLIKPSHLPHSEKKKLVTLEEIVNKTQKKSLETINNKVVDYDEDLVDEEELALKKMKQDREAGLALKRERKSLADEHLDPYKLEAKKNNVYHRLLHNKQGLKNAFILSEILNRKY